MSEELEKSLPQTLIKTYVYERLPRETLRKLKKRGMIEVIEVSKLYNPDNYGEFITRIMDMVNEIVESGKRPVVVIDKKLATKDGVELVFDLADKLDPATVFLIHKRVWWMLDPATVSRLAPAERLYDTAPASKARVRRGSG